MLVNKALAFKHFDIGVDHDLDKFLEPDFRLPAKLFLSFGRIADEEIDFGRTFVAGAVFDIFLPIEPDVPEGDFEKLFDGMGLVGGQHVIIRLVGLQHAPHTFDVFGGVTPVALGVHIAQIEFFLETELDRGQWWTADYVRSNALGDSVEVIGPTLPF